jgi:hypothetical protein
MDSSANTPSSAVPLARTRRLPPLILHPFADASGPDKLVESSRASLMLQGLLPSVGQSQEDLDRALLDGRYCEIRMLFYVGKDLTRWIEQCLEITARDPELSGLGIVFQSFAQFLIQEAPPGVQAKLRKWGVGDYKSIFTRALGLNAMFLDVPERDQLAPDFIRSYYRYADALFATRQAHVDFPDLAGFGFEFDIFASGEYSRMLEREWQEG